MIRTGRRDREFSHAPRRFLRCVFYPLQGPPSTKSLQERAYGKSGGGAEEMFYQRLGKSWHRCMNLFKWTLREHGQDSLDNVSRKVAFVKGFACSPIWIFLEDHRIRSG